MNTDYNKIKTRFISNVIIDSLISCEEAGYKIHKLFYEYERFVYNRIVMVEKYKKNLTKSILNNTHLGEMLVFYNKSLKRVYNQSTVFREPDLEMFVNEFLQKSIAKRIVIIEKADKNMAPLFDFRKGAWHTETPLDISDVVTEIDQVLEYYSNNNINVEF